MVVPACIMCALHKIARLIMLVQDKHHEASTLCCSCSFGDYATGPECVAVADWRAAVRNAGCDAPIAEVKALIAATPACLPMHGTDADRMEHDLLVKTAESGMSALSAL